MISQLTITFDAECRGDLMELEKKKRVQSKSKTRGFELYLGRDEEKAKNLASLEEQAVAFGAGSVSEYIQMIARKELIVSLPKDKD